MMFVFMFIQKIWFMLINMSMVTAMAPNYTTDRSGRIEMVAYFTTSQVSEVPLRSRSDPGMGTTLLLNEEGQVLFGDMGREELLAWLGENGAQLPNGTFNRRAALDPDGRTRNYLFILRQGSRRRQCQRRRSCPR